MNYENYPILIYDMTIISLVVYTGVYPSAEKHVDKYDSTV